MEKTQAGEMKMTDLEILKAYGHSAATAMTIILDAKRGDKFCIK